MASMGQTINSNCYLDDLKYLMTRIRREISENQFPENLTFKMILWLSKLIRINTALKAISQIMSN